MKKQFMKDMIIKGLYFYVPICFFITISFKAWTDTYIYPKFTIYLFIIILLMLPFSWFSIGKLYHKKSSKRFFEKNRFSTKYSKVMIRVGHNGFVPGYKKSVSTNIGTNLFKIFLIFMFSGFVLPFTFILGPTGVYYFIKDYKALTN
ncbi:hypothetical protein [Companilactobacillus sp. DQM5]|uniref:hypothetical protein n=1 Tax=Companilactobacillus sp. DQM5 TaxID=3463359 RepID=UPI00405A4B0A